MGYFMKGIALLVALSFYFDPTQFHVIWDTASIVNLALQSDPPPRALLFKHMVQRLSTVSSHNQRHGAEGLSSAASWLHHTYDLITDVFHVYSGIDRRLAKWRRSASTFQILSRDGCDVHQARNGLNESMVLRRPVPGANVSLGLVELRGFDGTVLYPRPADDGAVKLIAYIHENSPEKQSVVPLVTKGVEAFFGPSADDVLAGCTVRVRCGSDYAFGARGFYNWGVLPLEPLIAELQLRDVAYHAPG